MKAHILYVEDDKVFADLLSEKLKTSGYTVSIAGDGEEGLAKAKEEKTDLVLLDLLMPKMDGFEMLGRMNEDEALSKIPVVVLSNLGAQEDLNRAKDLGASVFLVKALSTPSDVVNSVEQVLSEN